MQRVPAARRIAAIGAALLALAACYPWFGHESRSRGHVFDAASREPVALMPDEGRNRLAALIQQEFPPGTPLADLIRHVEAAGARCAPQTGDPGQGDTGTAICTYHSISYGPFAFHGMGQPSFHESRNRWTVFISHSDGVIVDYEIEGETIRTQITRDDYLDRLSRQRAEERVR